MGTEIEGTSHLLLARVIQVHAFDQYLDCTLYVGVVWGIACMSTEIEGARSHLLFARVIQVQCT